MRVRASPSVALALALAACAAPASEEPPAGAGPSPEPISLTFERHSLKRQSSGCEDTSESPSEEPPESCAEISLTWVEITEAPPGVARGAIHGWIEGGLLAPAVGEEPAASPEALAKSFFADFESFRAEVPDNPGWSFERTIEPIHDDEQGLSFRLTESSYLGGAHPNTVTTYTTLYLTTGQPVALEDLLVDGDPSRLQELAEATFREVRELGPEDDLPAAGFWLGEGPGVDPDRAGEAGLVLSDSFAVTDDGLLFHYNPYEIGPYALGATTLTIPWAELDGVVAWPGHDGPAASGASGAQSAP